MKHFFMRLFYLLAGWGFVGLIYNRSAYFQSSPTILHPSLIDQLIPFNPHGIWLYLSFFILIPICFFYAPYYNVRWMSICFIVTSFFAGIIYLLCPTTMIFPIDTGTTLSSQLLISLIEIDTTTNCFPSLHVALTLIVVWGCFNLKKPIRTSLLILWGIGICFSTIQLRRHVFIDFIGGALLALIVGYAIRYCLNYFDRKFTFE